MFIGFEKLSIGEDIVTLLGVSLLITPNVANFSSSRDRFSLYSENETKRFEKGKLPLGFSYHQRLDPTFQLLMDHLRRRESSHGNVNDSERLQSEFRFPTNRSDDFRRNIPPGNITYGGEDIERFAVFVDSPNRENNGTKIASSLKQKTNDENMTVFCKICLSLENSNKANQRRAYTAGNEGSVIANNTDPLRAILHKISPSLEKEVSDNISTITEVSCILADIYLRSKMRKYDSVIISDVLETLRKCMDECMQVCFETRGNGSKTGYAGGERKFGDVPYDIDPNIMTFWSSLTDISSNGKIVSTTTNINGTDGRSFTVKSSTKNSSETSFENYENLSDTSATLFYYRSNTLNDQLDEICLSESCVLKAAQFLERMNVSVNPCDNFYEFSCGRYLNKETPYKMYQSVFSEVSSDILLKMNSLLKSPVDESQPLYQQIVKKFYRTCTETPLGQLLIDFLKELGGWPKMQYPWWSLSHHMRQEIVFNLSYGEFLEYNLILVNITEASDKSILNLGFPFFVKTALDANSYDVIDEMKQETVFLAKTLGVNTFFEMKVIKEVQVFMKRAIICANATKLNVTKGIYSLLQLKAMFPHLSVLKELPSLISNAVKIDDTEPIHVSNLLYLQEIDFLVRDTPLATQESYLIITALRAMSQLLIETSDIVIGKHCVKLLWRLYPHVLGYLYSKKFVDDTSTMEAENILHYIREHLKKTVLESEWLNNSTKVEAVNRANSLMFELLLYRKGIREDVDALLCTQDTSNLASIIKTAIWHHKNSAYMLLHGYFNDTITNLVERYYIVGYKVNAFYLANYIFIPFSVLHEDIFNIGLPSYINYGGIGFLFGHEMMHGVFKGNYLNKTSKYLVEEQCLVDQFDGFTERYLGSPVDGERTKEENKADLGGLREAYQTYLDRVGRHRVEKKLPGLQQYNQRQMFWLTFASNWCQIFSTESVINYYPDNHAPHESRVNGELANLPEFSSDFNCPLGSAMNSKQKCTLW